MENSRFIRSGDRVTKHELVIVLIKLEVFGFVPLGPVILFHKFPSSEFHHYSDYIPNVAINNNIPS
jgi:hypothetical protein